MLESSRTRRRWTIGRLMAFVAAAAVLCLILRMGEPVRELVACLLVAIAVPWWISVGGPARRRWGFIGCAGLFNGAMMGAIIYWPVEHDADIMVVVAVFGVIAYLWTTLAWAGSPQDRPVSSRTAALVVGLFAGPVITIATQWPWHLASYASSPALNRLADRIESGGALRPGGEWAGCYRIRATILGPTDVFLFTVPPTTVGAAGFIRTIVRPRPSAGWEVIGSDGSHVGRWHTTNSE